VNIRWKIVLIVLPLLIAPLLLTGVVSVLSARNGITSVATGFLQFKAEQLVNYAEGQWNLLANNGLENDPTYLEATKAAVETFARGLVRTPTERIFALGPGGAMEIRTGDVEASPSETEALGRLAKAGETGWQTFRVGGVDRVAHAAAFPPFHWMFFVSERSDTFYRSVNQIVNRTTYILGASLAAGVLLLLLFARYLTRPLRQVADAMTDIVATSDLSRRVEVLYRDETGRLSHAFNLMTAELEKAYGEIKGFALRAAVAQMKEQKVRNIFQRYVPHNVIEQFFANPEKMLVGEERVLAVLFSDIRNFTTISENLRPDEVVDSLNQYFARMVDSIMNRGGIVDKYIGDAIMAFFGAPVKGENDARESVMAAFDMLRALEDFNAWQSSKGRTTYHIGIGINYGGVTVGNIGSERKMDYTVIGDMVNLASRLEGLTKYYKEPLIVSESIEKKIRDLIPCRLLDRVKVKGRTAGSGIFSAKRVLTPREEEAWGVHNQAALLYYKREFPRAASGFRRVLEILPKDMAATRFLRRSEVYASAPPPEDWTGVEEMLAK
jgi:class 3 adenylate cyclase/HAMP domain-containing protein